MVYPYYGRPADVPTIDGGDWLWIGLFVCSWSGAQAPCAIPLGDGLFMEIVNFFCALLFREIDPILAILRSVLQCGTIRPSEIGILTPYDAQKARIRFALNDSFVSIIAGPRLLATSLLRSGLCDTVAVHLYSG